MQQSDEKFIQQLPSYWQQEQQHILPYVRTSSSLFQEISNLDTQAVQQAIDACLHGQSIHISDYKPAHYWPLLPAPQQQAYYTQAQQVGLDLITQGKVAAFTVAGGQGTRLGYDGPKGTLPVTLLQNKSLFQTFAEQIYAWNQRSTQMIMWYIMCSPLNIQATRDFFAHHHYFGLQNQQVRFFTQGVLPAFTHQGQVLLKDQHHLALSPNGHGGSFKALIDAHAIDEMQKMEIAHLSYFQVDNPLVHVFDPLFIGLHHMEQSDMSSRCLIKSHALEKLGNFVTVGEKLHIIEYSDLSDEEAHQRDEHGALHYRAGSPAIHVIRRDFIQKFATQDLQLPYHKALKKVPCLNADGQQETPTQPNAIKAETFVFDALPFAHNPLILEAQRSQQFSPVKNKTGADSLEQSRHDQNQRAHQWLQSLGYDIPASCFIEISSKVFPQCQDLQKAQLPTFMPHQSYYIDEQYLK